MQSTIFNTPPIRVGYAPRLYQSSGLIFVFPANLKGNGSWPFLPIAISWAWKLEIEMPNNLTFLAPASVLDNNGLINFIITEAVSAGSSMVTLRVMLLKSKYLILSVIVFPFASRRISRCSNLSAMFSSIYSIWSVSSMSSGSVVSLPIDFLIRLGSTGRSSLPWAIL